VCAGFVALAAQGDWRRLDACRSPDQVTADLQAAIAALVAQPLGEG
jgi:hypothetical protein